MLQCLVASSRVVPYLQFLHAALACCMPHCMPLHGWHGFCTVGMDARLWGCTCSCTSPAGRLVMVPWSAAVAAVFHMSSCGVTCSVVQARSAPPQVLLLFARTGKTSAQG